MTDAPELNGTPARSAAYRKQFGPPRRLKGPDGKFIGRGSKVAARDISLPKTGGRTGPSLNLRTRFDRKALERRLNSTRFFAEALQHGTIRVGDTLHVLTTEQLLMVWAKAVSIIHPPARPEAVPAHEQFDVEIELVNLRGEPPSPQVFERLPDGTLALLPPGSYPNGEVVASAGAPAAIPLAAPEPVVVEEPAPVPAVPEVEPLVVSPADLVPETVSAEDIEEFMHG